jgi:hypothetical protein
MNTVNKGIHKILQKELTVSDGGCYIRKALEGSKSNPSAPNLDKTIV